MVEAGIRPFFFAVTFFALLAIVTLVHIVEAMAVVAGTGLGAPGPVPLPVVLDGMAAMAIHASVRAPETKLGVLVMIETRLGPLFLAVAIVAFFTETLLVDVLDGMAGEALLRGFLVVRGEVA